MIKIQFELLQSETSSEESPGPYCFRSKGQSHWYLISKPLQVLSKTLINM